MQMEWKPVDRYRRYGGPIIPCQVVRKRGPFWLILMRERMYSEFGTFKWEGLRAHWRLRGRIIESTGKGQK
jgi:hypothetical protein